jgi:hypothetical protein
MRLFRQIEFVLGQFAEQMLIINKMLDSLSGQALASLQKIRPLRQENSSRYRLAC